LPLVLDPAWIEQLRAELPELPDAKKARFVAEYGLRPEDAGVLVAERAIAEYFEQVAQGRDPKAAANWVMGDLFGALNKRGLGIEVSPVMPGHLGALIDLIADGTISGRIAKDVFAEMVETGADAAAIVEKKGLRQVTDKAPIKDAVDAVLAAHPSQAAGYKTNPKVLGFFVGQVMKATGGKANPTLVNEIVWKSLAMTTTDILELLAKHPDAYIYDVGTGEIVLKQANGDDMPFADDRGRALSARFPYALIEGLIQQHYVTQDPNDARVYRISVDGLRAANS
jgi:Asp-tRNA(Asn)/Glu-tRNA(Gln) amidotransferase B subunit